MMLVTAEVPEQDLVGRHPAAADAGDQPLGDDGGEGHRELDADLVLLIGGEHVDDPVDGLGRVVGVQRGEHQVAGLGQGEGEGDRLEVAHLADQDDVGVLA